jgi:hypothetical protein
MRAAGRDENAILSPPRVMTLEAAINLIREDELVEITPKSIRMRKAILPAAKERTDGERPTAHGRLTGKIRPGQAVPEGRVAKARSLMTPLRDEIRELGLLVAAQWRHCSPPR